MRFTIRLLGVEDLRLVPNLHLRRTAQIDAAVRVRHRFVFDEQFDVAVLLANKRWLGRAARLELAGRGIGGEQDRQFLDRDLDQLGGVLGDIGIVREHRRDRLADIAHELSRQNGLAIGCKALDAGQAKVDGRDVGDIG